MAKAEKHNVRVGDEALRKRTGKSWREWFAILDKAGARKMSHKEIAALLYKRCGCPGWWSQMVAVGYEQARGLREKYQKPGGYEISRSKTVAVSLVRLFRAWQEEKFRRRWLAEKVTVRKATRNQSMRITWADGATSLDVNFYPRGAAKSMVAVQHGKLADTKAAERMKAFWAKALDRLATVLEA